MEDLNKLNLNLVKIYWNPKGEVLLFGKEKIVIKLEEETSEFRWKLFPLQILPKQQNNHPYHFLFAKEISTIWEILILKPEWNSEQHCSDLFNINIIHTKNEILEIIEQDLNAIILLTKKYEVLYAQVLKEYKKNNSLDFENIKDDFYYSILKIIDIGKNLVSKKTFILSEKAQRIFRLFYHDLRNLIVQWIGEIEIFEIENEDKFTYNDLEKLGENIIFKKDEISELCSGFLEMINLNFESEKKELNVLVSKLQSHFENKDLTFSINLKAKFFEFNEDEILSFINNLIKNSERAIEGLEDWNIELKIYNKGVNLIVIVSDNWKGISKDIRNDIFIKEVTTKKDDWGEHGVGLFTIYQEIKNSGWDISFESSENWTIFKFNLPILS